MNWKFGWKQTGIGVILSVFLSGTAFAAPDETEVSYEVLQDLKDDITLEDNSLNDTEDSEETFDLDTGLQDITTESLKISDLQAVQDPASGGFRYTLPNGSWFVSNVPAGAVTTGKIQLTLSDDLYLFEAKRNDSLLNPSDGTTFSETGTYELMLHTGNLDEEGPMIFYELSVPFQICGPLTNLLSEISVPYGFHIQEAILDGKERQKFGNRIVLDEDGTWQLTFSSDADSQAVYRLKFVLDRKAPELLFSKPIDQGAVRPPLTIRPAEENCEILVRKGSEPVSLQNQALTYGGLYQVIARDRAGNERSYNVQIRYQIFQSGLNMIILSVLLSGLGVYLFYLRRHTRVL